MRGTAHARSWGGRLLAVFGGALAFACGGDPQPGPDIVLITLDTTRLDRLGVYGYSGGTTPNLDRFAESAAVYTRAVSTASWTYPAHVSLFTGKFPSSHGARYDPEGSLLLTSVIDGPNRWRQFRVRGIASDERTLAQLLSQVGYRTGAVVAGPWLKRIMGLDAGFDIYDDDDISSMNGRTAPEITDRGLEFVRENTDRRFFLFLNYFDPHAPWKAPDVFRRDPPDDQPVPSNPGLSQRYDAEVRFMDHHLGRLFDGLSELGRYDGSWILITSDHGESLGEHGLLGHGNTLYEELIRTPLIVKSPAGEGPTGRIDTPAQQVDVFATILDRLGIEPPPGIQGEPLGRVEHPIISELYPLEFMQRALRKTPEVWRGDVRSLQNERYKFIESSLGLHQLFDLRADPYERDNRIAADPDVAAAMHAELDAYLATLPEPGADTGLERTVDPETEEALRNLGYLE